MLVSSGYMLLRVLPQKPNRAEVRDMIDRHPITRQVTDMQSQQDRGYEELKGIREEIGRLREDVTRLATTVELVLTKLL